MTNILYMSWVSSSANTFNFVDTKTKHGDPATASPTTLRTGGPSTVEAKQSTNVTPGAEGTYLWQSVDLKEQVTCDYHFPAGSPPQTITMTLTPSGGVEVSRDGTNYTSSKLPMSFTANSKAFTANCFIRDKS